MTTPAAILHAALHWHQRGFAVQPKSRGAKHWNKPAHQRPPLDTPAAIRREFSAGDYDGVKISPASHQCVAFDFDVQHNGLALYSAMLALFPFLGETYTERTGGGGLRVFLKVDGDLTDLTGKITWDEAHDKDGKPTRETRLELFVHEFVVVAPSIHPNGQPYTVEKPLAPAPIDCATLNEIIAWGNHHYPKADPFQIPFRPRTTVHTHDYEQFYTELTAAAERTFAIKSYNSDGRSNAFRNVLRDEKKPSAVYHREKHYLYDYAQARTYPALELARLLGVDPPESSQPPPPKANLPPPWTILPEAAREALAWARLPGEVAECLIEQSANRQLGATFTIADLLRAQTGRWNLDERKLRRGLTKLTGVVIDKITHSRDHTMGKSVPKAAPKGKMAQTYTLLPPSQLVQNLLDYARPRIFEHFHAPDSQHGILVEFTPDMLAAADQSEGTAPLINAVTAPARAAQGKPGTRARQNAEKTYRCLQVGLAAPQFNPLPDGWIITNAADYKTARAKVMHSQAPDEPIAHKDAARRLGVTRKTAAGLLARAGLQGSDQPTQAVRVLSAEKLRQQVKQATAQVNGKAQPFLVVNKPNGLSEEIPFSSDNAARLEQATADHLQRGHVVNIKIRAAKIYHVVRDAPPPSQKVAVKCQPAPSKVPDKWRQPTARLKVIDNFVGRTYSPVWVREQLKLALIRTQRAEYHSDLEAWVDPSTGANVDSLTAPELVQLLCTPHDAPPTTRMESMGGDRNIKVVPLDPIRHLEARETPAAWSINAELL